MINTIKNINNIILSNGLFLSVFDINKNKRLKKPTIKDIKNLIEWL